MSTMEGQILGWLEPPTADAPAAALEAEAMTTDAITALVEQYSSALYRVAYSVTRNAAEAEDAVQETFLRVLRHREKLAEIRDLRVWLVRITWNLVLDRKRRAKTRPEHEDVADLVRVLPAEGPGAEAGLISDERYHRLLGLIDQLPRKEREALLLSAQQELATPQIAAILGTTESSVRSRIFRARRELAALLARERISR